MKQRFNRVIWVIVFLLVVFAWVFGLFIDLTGDSGLYAAITRQMIESGDWLNLKINGVPYDQKPHLLFWLAGAGVSLFGYSNFAFKLFPFLFGLSGIYFTYQLGRLLYSEKAGRTAALITGSSQIYFLYFLDIHTDSILQAGVMLSLWQIAAYLKFKKSLNFVWGFAGIGLAMLSKGPIGAVLPFLFVLFNLTTARDFKQLLHPKWLIGIFIVLVVISPTLYHLYQSFGIEGITFYFITNNFGRISGSYAGSSNDPFFYLYNLLWAMIPWTWFVLKGLTAEIKSWKTKNSDSCGISLVLSLIVLFIILSIAKGKAPNYMLICIAPLGLITAKWISIENQSEKRERKNMQNLFYSLLISAVINLFMNVYLLPELFKHQGPRQVISLFEQDKSPDKKLYNLEIDEFALFYYAKEMPENLTDWNRIYDILDKPNSWIYTNSIKYKDITGMNYKIDTVYTIRQRGMNKISLQFLNPAKRNEALYDHYLIKTK